jgi:hypothetical protein
MNALSLLHIYNNTHAQLQPIYDYNTSLNF